MAPVDSEAGLKADGRGKGVAAERRNGCKGAEGRDMGSKAGMAVFALGDTATR